jgi:hypothetical protein
MGEPREIRWSWASKENDLRTGYMAVDGRMSIAELIEHMREVAPGVALGDIQINWATCVWSRDATPEEVAQRREAERRWEARHEAWERETYARLLKKFGPPPAADHQVRLAEETS